MGAERKRWTNKELKDLKVLWSKMHKEELEEYFGRSYVAIKHKSYRLNLEYKERNGKCTKRSKALANKRKGWSKEEEEYIIRKWGKTPLKRMAQYLKRTENSVYIRARKLGFDNYKANSDFFSISELSIAFSSPNAGTYVYNLKRWTDAGLEVEERLMGLQLMRVVRKNKFWEFAYENKELFDFGKLERFVLDEEPDWVEAERVKSRKEKELHPNRHRRWSEKESNLLISRPKSQRFTYEEIAEYFGRTVPGVASKLVKLGVPYRPLTRRDCQ